MMPVIPLTAPISGLFWKLSSFLIPPERRTVMTVHSTSFPTDQPVRPAAAEALLPAAVAAPQVLTAAKLNLRKLLFTGAAIAVLAGAAWYGWDYWTVGQYLVSTDDAYVKADNTTVAPKISGYLREVLVGDNERVKAGQTLARIDDRDYRVALDLLKAEIAQANAALARAEAVQGQAELNLDYTSIIAPIDGVVGNRTLRAGQFVQAGTQLMSVVPVAGAYVVANFKETQLTDVRAGQAVDIAVDMFPGRVVHGHVDSIAPASGQEFALLPPDNATGNFTKVVQRIPVKIALNRDNSSPIELRPGMSVIPTIETKPQVPSRDASAASKISNTSSGGSCHVKSHPVGSDAAELWRQI